MKRVVSVCVIFLGVMVLRVGFADAAVLYDNGFGADDQLSGYFSSDYRDWRVYDDFSLGGDSSIDSVWFQQGTTSGRSLDSFTFSVYENSSHMPGSLLFTQSLAIGDYTATPNSIDSYPFGQFYDIEFDIDSMFNLAAGDYWLSFYGTGRTDFRTPNVGSGNSYLQVAEALNIFEYREGDTPFRLYGSIAGEEQPPVPEPATLFLLGAGVLGFFRLRKKV